jgi:uncharacterized membrane protein (DUF4010 family)
MLDTPLSGAIVSMLIGLLLGIEREHSQRGDGEKLFAGARTFPLLAVSGYIATLGAAHGLTWLLPVVLAAIASLAVASYLRNATQHVGATTQAAAILAPLLGALVAWHETLLAASLAVIVTMLLTLKTPLHRIAGAITQQEIAAILKFGIIAVVLTPLLPTKQYGPYGALVPRQIGMVVVVLTAVSLLGYLLVRLTGGRTGWSLAGLLGGLASSTAVTLSFSGKARALADQTRALAAGIVLASTVLYARSVFVLALFDRELALRLTPALIALFVGGAVMGFILFRTSGGAAAEEVRLGNPVELGQALALATFFILVLLAARVAEARLGSQGLLATGLVGGLIDVDSVLVAAASLRVRGVVSFDLAATTCLLASLSNLILKGALVMIVGRRQLARLVLAPFVGLIALTLIIIALAIG